MTVSLKVAWFQKVFHFCSNLKKRCQLTVLRSFSLEPKWKLSEIKPPLRRQFIIDGSFILQMKMSVQHSNSNLKTLWLNCVTYVDGRALLYYAKTWLIALSYTYSTNICFAYVCVKWELGLRSEDFTSKKGNSVRGDPFLKWVSCRSK